MCFLFSRSKKNSLIKIKSPTPRILFTQIQHMLINPVLNLHTSQSQIHTYRTLNADNASSNKNPTKHHLCSNQIRTYRKCSKTTLSSTYIPLSFLLYVFLYFIFMLQKIFAIIFLFAIFAFIIFFDKVITAYYIDHNTN